MKKYWELLEIKKDQHAVTGPIKGSADAQHANAVCWPAKKPFADRPFFAICWPAIVMFLLYADRPCQFPLFVHFMNFYFLQYFCYMLTGHVNSHYLYILWNFISCNVFAICWPTNWIHKKNTLLSKNLVSWNTFYGYSICTVYPH